MCAPDFLHFIVVQLFVSFLICRSLKLLSLFFIRTVAQFFLFSSLLLRSFVLPLPSLFSFSFVFFKWRKPTLNTPFKLIVSQGVSSLPAFFFFFFCCCFSVHFSFFWWVRPSAKRINQYRFVFCSIRSLRLSFALQMFLSLRFRYLRSSQHDRRVVIIHLCS